MKLSLSIKIIIASAVITALVGILSGYFVFERTNLLLLESKRQSQLLSAQQIAETIDRIMYNQLLNIQLISGSVPIRKLIGGEAVSQAEVKQRVDEFAQLSGPWYNLDFYYADGREAFSSEHGMTNEHISDFPSDYGLFQKALSGEVVYSDLLMSGDASKPTVLFAAPIMSGNRVIGVVIGRFAWPVVLEILETSGYDKIYLVNHSGYLIGSGDASQKSEILKATALDGVAFSTSSKPQTLTTAGLADNRAADSLISLTPCKGHLGYSGNNWHIEIKTPLSDVAAAVLTVVLAQLWIIMAITIIAFILVYFSMYLFIIKPVRELTIAANEILNGNLKVRIKARSADEIGDLSNTFNVMVAKLRESYASMEKNVKDKTKSLADTVNSLKDKNNELEQTKKSVLNILEDIEEEKKRADALAHDLEKFQLAVANASDHIVITDPDGIILFANKSVEKITGFKASEVLGKKAGAKELWGGLMGKDFYEAMWKTIKIDKQPFAGEIENQRKNGEHYFAWASISPILGEDGQVAFFVAIERDITVERQIDKAKTEFVSLASHQLRTPLSAINWYAEMLLAGDAGKLNKEQDQYLKEIYAGNKRMVDLVNALLNVSRIDLGTFAIEPKPTDFCAIAQSVLAELKPDIAAKKIKVADKCDQALPLISADPKLIRIIIQNLLTNAIKYTPESGNVEISLNKRGKNVEIAVKDDGYGIPENAKSKIFTKLYRADNVREKDTEGTGLGLYIVKAIVEQAKGEITFDSVEDKGTSFYVRLPLSGMAKKSGTKELAAIK